MSQKTHLEQEGNSTQHHGGGDANDPSVIQINQSNETVQAVAGKNVFVIASPTQTGDVINGFTLGQDVLKIHAHGDLSAFTVQESNGNTVVMDGTNTLVTLNGVQTTSLQALLEPEHPEPTVVHIDQSSQTVAATAGKDIFVFGSPTQTGDVITGFTPGQDALAIHGLHGQALTSAVTLVPDADGVSTDVNLTSDGHTLVTLENVLPGALTVHSHFIA